MNALRMTSVGLAGSKVQRNNFRNNINSQFIYNSAAIRAFASKTVPVPSMGDSISEGVIEEFIKSPGDFVLADEIIARIETDKVTVDITSPESGVIKQYFSAEGDTVDVGADFFEIDTDAVAPAASAAPTTPEPAASATP